MHVVPAKAESAKTRRRPFSTETASAIESTGTANPVTNPLFSRPEIFSWDVSVYKR